MTSHDVVNRLRRITGEQSIGHLGTLDPGPVWSGYLGCALFGFAAVAIGMMLSSLTESDVVAFFPSEWQRDPSSPFLASGHHNVPWDDPRVLKHCFDSLPQSQSPSRRAAIEVLLTSAPKREVERLAPVFG